MVLHKYKHSFVRQWLQYHNWKIYRGEERILPPLKSDIFDIQEILSKEPIIDTRIEKGYRTQKKRELRKITSYRELLNRGIIVDKRKVSGKFYRYQKVEFFLKRKKFDDGIGDIPKEHYVVWDVANDAFKLIGRNVGGESKWFHKTHLSTQKKVYDKYNMNSMISMASEIRKSWLPPGSGDKIYQSIPELAFMRAEGKIICIPDNMDEPTIGIPGQKRFGKSFLMNRIVGNAFYKFHKKIILLNDLRDEVKAYCLPWEPDSPFAKQLETINERSLSLPCVYLYPNTYDLSKLNYEDEHISYRMSMPFSELAKDPEMFLKGKEDWDFNKSGKFFRIISDELKDIPYGLTKADLLQAIEDICVGNEKIPKNSIQKILAIFEDIYNQKILDISNGIPPKWKINNTLTKFSGEYDPTIACMICDLVPVIETSTFEKKSYFPLTFKYIVERILQTQTKDLYFKENQFQIWAFIDELEAIASMENKSVASDVIKELVASGGPIRIGTVYATQFLPKIFPDIIHNTDYMFSVKEKDEGAKIIYDLFDLEKSDRKEIQNLNKWEIFACTDRHFITYDADGNRRKERGPFKGEALPPLNLQLAPKMVSV